MWAAATHRRTSTRPNTSTPRSTPSSGRWGRAGRRDHRGVGLGHGTRAGGLLLARGPGQHPVGALADHAPRLGVLGPREPALGGVGIGIHVLVEEVALARLDRGDDLLHAL